MWKDGAELKSAWFVTGTDTEIGKTVAACALLHRLRRDGLSAVAMKPVAAGCEQGPAGWINEDVVALSAAASIAVDPRLLNPYLFRDPIAPHIAAAREGIDIDFDHIRACFDRLGALADAVVVEGAGGFLVPLGATTTSADLAARLGVPLVLVVGMRLGCINHALLTQEAIATRGLTLAGWIANRIDPDMLQFDANLEALRQRLNAPLLGVLPRLPVPDPALLCDCLELPRNPTGSPVSRSI